MPKTKKNNPPPPEIKVKEVANPVDVVVVRLYCSTDNIQMEQVGKILPLAVPMYTYQCPKCKHKQVSHNEYPMLVYKEKNNDKNLSGTNNSPGDSDSGVGAIEQDAGTTPSQ